ncbi:MAG: sugar phosphorylase [Desulfosalsimonadaceae bacterium]
MFHIAEADAPLPPGRLPEPDYSRPAFVVPQAIHSRIRDKLLRLYGKAEAEAAFREIERLMQVFCAHMRPEAAASQTLAAPRERFTEKDSILITYGDMIRGDDAPPLVHLARFAETWLPGCINCIHILPFFPYSSDRGFAVVDYRRVDPDTGNWAHITRIRKRFQLMVDLVLNHVSANHAWFREFTNANPRFRPFFISFADKTQLREEDRRKIVRPRTTNLLTQVAALDGEKAVWSTFSSDQMDLNYGHWPVLARIIEVLLFYVLRGAEILRLDAIAYLWKEPGTSCIHLPQTHLVVKLMRDVLDAVAPHTAIITETNVPHAENVSYFGNGRDEAQLVYNFSLPPLLLYTFFSGSARRLTSWVQSLEPVSSAACFFNFMDSHDGIGLPGARGLLTEDEIEIMGKTVQKRGGRISYKENSDGTCSPYEFNITCYSALNDPETQEPESTKIRRYLAARSIPLALAGVPGIYIHGLLGSPNNPAAMDAGAPARSINRSTLDPDRLNERLHDADTREHKIFEGFRQMLVKRSREKAFHPDAPQQALRLDKRLFALLRKPEAQAPCLLCITSVSSSPVCTELYLNRETFLSCGFSGDTFIDILSGCAYKTENNLLRLRVEPYEVLWLKPALKKDTG